MARKRIEIDEQQFNKLCDRQHTLEYIADWFNCSEDTIERWCKRTYKRSFADIRRKKKERCISDLRGKMVEVAMSGNVTMLIYLSKNWMGMSDKPEQALDTEDSDTYFEEAGI